jgi:CCR4-NOT transcription complex subunit 3
MELFKICEKETKTKAYSKEGLARETTLDPKELEREDKRNWINDCLQRLGDIIDSVEVELEKVSGGSKAKSKNKEAVRNSNNSVCSCLPILSQIERFENRLKKNKWHITKLEEVPVVSAFFCAFFVYLLVTVADTKATRFG